MLRQIAHVGVALGLGVLAACGSSTPNPGTPVEIHQISARGPRIPNGAIFAAGDLDTLRALIDAGDSMLARQLGGSVVTHVCQPPYKTPGESCWPGRTSQPGDAYIALDIQGEGMCETASAPHLTVSGRHLQVGVDFSEVAGCHIQGVMALPSASLISLRTGGLRSGLYSVSYLFQYPKDSYRSDSTYLSIPGPPAGTPEGMSQEAALALVSIIGWQPAGVFSVARVDGAQLAALCGQALPGPAYLAIYERDLSATPRRMTVVLAGPVPRTCSTTSV
ncbi:MAG: hypothetical protein J2O47_05230 [Acidimicrobiaceae bacterium]|nr:hypothetical protein [Acidimicrobiaceae bacterium]